jgi:hypothetical protein
MAAPNVKFARDITRGCSGKDVIAHKRAISRAAPKRYPWHDFTPYAGDRFMRAVMEWKRSKNMNSLPRLGRTAHEVLERTHAKDKPREWAFDAVAIKLAAEYFELANVKPESKVRQAIVSSAFFWYSKRERIAYSQYRPFQVGKPLWVPSRWDCSAFVTNCHYAGGAPDPNGRNYDHLGYTGTLISHGARASGVAALEPGDLIFYGRTRYGKPGFPAGSPTHVALYVGLRGGRHMVISNGSYPMGYYPYNYRSDINHYRRYKVA